MRKYILLIVVLLVCVTGFGQAPATFVPDFNIKPAETASLLKFLETPVSYNSGLVNLSVPIYTIKQGDITYPISIDYNSSGVSVNERAGWVGMGFSISQPQVIRNIKGLPDDYGGYIYETEYAYENIVNSLINVQILSLSEWLIAHPGGTWGQYALYLNCQHNLFTDINEDNRVWDAAHHAAVGGLVDLESDEYRVILPTGENVRFYFSHERTTEFPYGKIIQFPTTTNKIIPLFTEQYITGWEVTDSNGFKYEFTVGNATNGTKSYAADADIPMRGESTTHNYLVSWMLRRIISPTNNVLDFTYDNYYYEDCNFTGQTRLMDDFTFGNEPFVDAVTTNYQLIYGQNNYLKRIQGTFGKVEFNIGTSTREDYVYGKKLSSIKIYSIVDNNDILISNYGLNYIYKTSEDPTRNYYTCGYDQITHFGSSDITKRLFLDSIVIMGNNNDTNHKPFYRFEYNDTPLPHRFSYATDWWGYYNGQDNDIIVPTVRETDNKMPKRNVNPAYSQAGILNKVYFPTGGNSEFEYENNRGLLENGIINWCQRAGGYQAKIDQMNIVPAVRTGFVFNSNQETPTITYPSGGGQLMKYQKDFILNDNITGHYKYGFVVPTRDIGFFVRFKPNCTSCLTANDSLVSLPNRKDCYIKYRVLKGSTVVNDYRYITMNEEVHLEFEVGGTGVVEAQNLTLEVEVFTGGTGAVTVFEATDIAELDISWRVIDPDLARKINNSYEMPVGGHRIKSIKNYDADNSLAVEKRFSYIDENGVDSSTINYKLTNNYIFANKAYITSDNYYPFTSYNGQPVGYSLVKEEIISASGNLRNTFRYPFYSNPQGYNNCYFYLNSFGYGTFPCADNPYNGLLIENKVGNEKMIQNGFTNPFHQLSVPYIKGYNAFNKVPIDYVFAHNWDYAKYEIATFYPSKVDVSVTTDYFGTSEVVTVTESEYENAAHQQLSSQTTTNSKGETIETDYFYPQDSQIVGEPHMQDLIAKNMIATPIKTENYKGTTKLSEQLTVYNDWGSGLLLPEFIKTAKGNNTLKKEVIFTQYDTLGHPLELKKENGTVVSYIWGYNKTQPIAKIENATNAQIESAIGAVTNLNESDLVHINDLRNTLPNAMVTTFTYIPLIGVSTITDPKGYTTIYEYDSFGRLSAVKDAQGNILSENEYNYRTQN